MKEMICPYCNKPAEWLPNEAFYGKRFGKSYMCWCCKACRAYVGCHNNTRQPLGTMANTELRKWRMEAHKAIDPLWKSGKYKRKTVYARLADAFGEEIHVGEADIERCKDIIKTANLIFL
jgi:hypothetical protein